MSDQYPQYPQHPEDPRQGPSGHQSYGHQPYSHQPYPGHQAAPATMSPQDERTWGAISHAGAVVAMICSAGFLGFLASIAVYVMHKDRGPFVRAHAANSLNVQIMMFIWLVLAAVAYVVLGVVTLGLGFVVFLPVFLVPPVVAGIMHVIGAIKAYQGEWWTPPLTPAFVK
ncbi:DUF4870 domain-containing protein [Nocardioides sp. SYSU D00065]|uniref:DUF4870 domain-containing protein n=1 Tax=Nocardioides sp. SYSU D00065 TaxID=2817378 RepID=UPI001B33911D|nr:DUF4870 domain-containing protein [Nocardioides sp. SYSU D00065]